MIGATSPIAVVIVLAILGLGFMFAYGQGWFGEGLSVLPGVACDPQVTPTL